MKNTSLETEPSNKAEIGAMTAALYGNSFKSMHPAVQATGFRTHGLRYRTLSHSNHARVAEDFLVNSRCHRNDTETQLSIQNYFLDPGIEMLALVGKREGSILGEVRLPEGVELRRGLGEAIARRRSRRIYTGDPIELRYLATILRGAGSLTGHVTVA